MAFKVGMIPYTNMEPFRLMGPPAGGEFVSWLPSNSIGALLEGQIVAAAVPVGGLPQLEGVTESLGRFGIAAPRASMSVLLFSRRPFEELKRPMTLALTGESASSVRLLYLLFRQRLGAGQVPWLVTDHGEADGCLLIGDKALEWRRRFCSQGTVEGFANMADLAVLWHRYFGRPFVFARWVVRRDAPGQVRKCLEGWLHRFRSREDALVEEAASVCAGRLAMPEAEMKKYFHTLRRCLTASDLEGQKLFLEKMEALSGDRFFRPRPGGSLGNPGRDERRKGRQGSQV